MSDDDPIPLEGIPVFTGDLALLDVQVGALTRSGAALATAAGDVHSTFGGLQAFYRAPEADQLFATTQPVADRGASLKEDLATITAALTAYAQDAGPLVEKLKQLKRDAGAFRVTVNARDDWREDGELVAENNRRHAEIAETWAAFQAVERACYNKIVALVDGPPLRADDGSGRAHTYGYDAEALKHAEGLPWGDPVEESKPWWQHVGGQVWDFAKGFVVDGIGGTAKGLGTLFGTEGWDAAGQAWTGLGKLATGLTLSNPATALVFFTVPEDQLPDWLRDSREAVPTAAKAMLAWDQWGENPARAAGTVTFNALTALATGGTGAAVSGAGKGALAARAVAYAGRAGRAVDPMTYVFKGAGAGLRTVGDLTKGLRGGAITVPAGSVVLPEGAFKLPDGTLHLPPGAAVPDEAFAVPSRSVRLAPGTEIPPGAVDLGDGVVRLPEGMPAPAGSLRIPEGALKLPGNTTALPENVLRVTDEAGNTVYLDGHGNLLRKDGTLVQHNSAAHPENPPPRTTTTPETTLVGAHGGAGATTHTTGGPPRPPSGAGVSGGGHAGGAHPPVSRPDFMADGPNPYGKPGSLTREQIEEIQVYRANEEPGYLERYYKKDGARKLLRIHDESGYTPPQLSKVPGTNTWTRAKDVPDPPKPHFLDEDYIRVGADTVKSRARLRLLDTAAYKRRAAIRLDTIVREWRAAATRDLQAHNDMKSRVAFDQATDAYTDAHAWMTKSAEEFGEQVAEHHFMADRHPDFERQPLGGPRNGNDQFDQVWTHEDGRVIVIEAKSSVGTELGSRTLPDGNRVSQGSQEYFLDIIDKMRDRGERKTAKMLKKALADGNLEYVVIKGEKSTGRYTGYRYRRFDISKGTLP
ncbi:hypothetical protein MHW47_20545 [Streptomyces sp. OfavH-34-F]|uniref:hypothetical protein n=1 Tax=Streptomyces sp. OfavH-34-F TaxID=2917760 RepID=UPI001EF3AD3C|nr:hypothetical protein [Streptomyces sp. OfavH-34-F]MCG7526827.1 hypothetical protein [Streptomyces sp. OfavH-34-F]